MDKSWNDFVARLEDLVEGSFGNSIEVNEGRTLNTFEDVQSFLGGIRNVNAGGCGIAAYSMYLWLKKMNQLPEDFSIIYLHSLWDKEVLDSNKQFLEGKGDDIHSCVHAVVKMNGKVIDSKGDYEIYHPLSLEIGADHVDRFMVNSLNKPEWNPTFNRNQHIPAIQKALGVDLSNVSREV